MEKYLEHRKEQGFTLIELLVAIVIVGILAAVAVVGIAGLTKTGGQSACKSSADAAKAASAAYYANQTPNAWPATFNDLVTANPKVYEKGSATINGGDPNVLDGANGWHITMTPDATNGPTFACT